jgi:hypothetical protein
MCWCRPCVSLCIHLRDDDRSDPRVVINDDAEHRRCSRRVYSQFLRRPAPALRWLIWERRLVCLDSDTVQDVQTLPVFFAVIVSGMVRKMSVPSMTW